MGAKTRSFIEHKEDCSNDCTKEAKSQMGDDKQTFCCNFGITSSSQIVCELYAGSKIVD